MRIIVFCLLCQFTLVSGYLFDSENCLPPSESGENLFPRCKEIYGNVEFLYWGVDEGALDYAIKQENPSWVTKPGISSAYPSGKVQQGSYNFNPGVRVLLGFYNAPKYWELFGQYTFYQTQGRSQVTAPRQNNLYLVATFPIIGQNSLLCAKSDLKFNYQILDVMFSRVFDPNPHLRRQPLAPAPLCPARSCKPSRVQKHPHPWRKSLPIALPTTSSNAWSCWMRLQGSVRRPGAFMHAPEPRG